MPPPVESDESFAVEGERARATINSIRDGIIGIDADGVVLTLNPAAELLTGKKNAEAAGRPLDEILQTSGPAHHFQASRLTGKSAASGPAAGAHERCDFRAADGSIRRGLVSAAPVQDRSGRVIGSVICLRDMTEFENANAALQQALEDLVVLSNLEP